MAFASRLKDARIEEAEAGSLCDRCTHFRRDRADRGGGPDRDLLIAEGHGAVGQSLVPGVRDHTSILCAVLPALRAQAVMPGVYISRGN